MRIGRAAATVSTISNDRVLIAGGMVDGGSGVREFEVFDAVTRRIIAVGDMSEARIGQSATTLIAGGGRFAEVFDPRTNAFTRVAGDLGQDYSFASGVLLGNGDAFVLGGYDRAMHHTDGIWRFRP